MKRLLFHAIDRAACMCWLMNRDWTWEVPVWPGRDPDGWYSHSLGSMAYRFESRVLCSRFMDWLIE